MLLTELSIVLGLIFKVFGLYFFLMCVFFFIPKQVPKNHAPSTRFACLIAARNEEAVIGNLIDSLKSQDYPKDLIKVYVIPNNCTDNTEKAALSHGAEIIRCKGPVKSKGDALHIAVRQLLSNDDIDAFLIFDADNIVDPGYMKAMNDAFLSGAQVTKSRIESKNPYSSWVSGCYGLYYNIFNNFFNESRSRLGISPKLIGTGLGIRRDALMEFGGWNTITIAEDTEFNADCVLKHMKIKWVKEAVTYDETPESFSVSMKQRKRWISGIMEVARERVPDILCEMRKGHHLLQLFDMMMILIMPYYQVFSVMPTILLIISSFNSDNTSFIWLAFAGICISYIGTTAFAVLLCALSPYRMRSMWRSILMFPVFTLSWMPLCCLALFTKKASWEQIRHSHTVSLGELSYARYK